MRLIAILLVFACGWVVAAAQDNFPDVQEGHAGYKAYARLRAEGFMVSDPVWNTARLKDVMARALAKGVQGLHANLEQVLGDARRSPIAWPYDEVATFSHVLFDDFRTAIDSVRAELKKQGNDPDKLLKELDAERPLAAEIIKAITDRFPTHGFRDVPTSHWAWRAVQELKDAAILSGYPEAGFKG